MRPRNGAEFSVDNSIGEATFRVSSDVRPDGGIGRRAGLKIQFPLKKCGFDPHSGHQKSYSAKDFVSERAGVRIICLKDATPFSVRLGFAVSELERLG